jgi:hypothetical protein
MSLICSAANAHNRLDKGTMSSTMSTHVGTYAVRTHHDDPPSGMSRSQAPSGGAGRDGLEARNVFPGNVSSRVVGKLEIIRTPRAVSLFFPGVRCARETRGR